VAGRDAPLSGRVISFGPFRLLRTQRLLLRGEGVVPLGSRALDLLIALVDHAGDVVGKEVLKSHVWPNTVVEDANIKVQIATLRRALGDGRGGARYVATVSGRGYSFVAPLTIDEPAETSERTIPAMLPQVGPRKRAHNLPTLPTRLVGRADDASKVAQGLSDVRLITIVGPGGCGKTSVALAVAERVIREYENGVWLVELAPIADPDLVPSAVASVVGIDVSADDSLPGLVRALSDQRMLVVLDNCEHVIDIAASLAVGLLRGAPGVHVLATSRERLRVQGEQVHHLGPLATPPAGARLGATEAVRYPAVELFVARAAASSGGFVLRDEDAPVVGEICRKLDGLPLAIEIAAARFDAFGVRELSARLEDRLRFLTHGRRDDLARHQTMRATLDWSYGLLSRREQRKLRRLAIFAGGFSLEAAEAIIGDPGAAYSEVTDQLLELVAKSLVAADVRGAKPRYRLLEITRAYALEKLAEAGEAEAVARRHADYYLGLLEAAASAPVKSAECDRYAAFAAEIDNLRAALEWAFARGGDAALAVTLAAASGPVWLEMSLLTECRRWMEAAISKLADADAVGTRQEMTLQTALGLSLIYTQKKVSDAPAILTRASELADSFQDLDFQLRAYSALALFRLRLEDFHAALALARQAEVMAKRSADAIASSTIRCIIGCSLYFLGQYAEALTYLGQASARITPAQRHAQILRSGMDYSIMARCFAAHILWLQGLLEQSARSARDVLSAAEAGGHPASLCQALLWCGCRIPLRLGDLATAERSIAQVKDLAEKHGFSSYHALGLGYEGELYARRGDVTAGARMLRACVGALRDSQYGHIYTAFLTVLAEVLASACDTVDAFAAAAESVERAERSDAFWWMPEALRVKGEIILLQGGADTTAAEDHFHRSLEWARRQRAPSWELRTAMSLARLLLRLGRRAEAHDMLAAAYGGFSEGFGFADLRAAKQLLDELV